MSDQPKNGTVPMDSALVKQHHRLAEGLPVDGQKLPSEPAAPKTPA